MARRGRKGTLTPKKVEIEKRRANVATLVLSGRTQREIASTLGVGLATVNGDVKALVTEWRESQRNDTDAARFTDLARIDVALKAIWLRVSEGNLHAIDRMERLIRLRKDILGYSDNLVVEEKDWQPITTVEVVKDYGTQTIDGVATLLDDDDDDGMPAIAMKAE